jgi:hypothetical protein
MSEKNYSIYDLRGTEYSFRNNKDTIYMLEPLEPIQLDTIIRMYLDNGRTSVNNRLYIITDKVIAYRNFKTDNFDLLKYQDHIYEPKINDDELF